MIIGSISENKKIEKRISITPDIAKKYISNGFQILLESDYGSHLGISNDEFLKEGCKIDKKENILNQSDFVYEYEIEKMNSEEIIYKIIYNNNPEKFLNTLKVNDININSSSDIWYIE